MILPHGIDIRTIELKYMGLSAIDRAYFEDMPGIFKKNILFLTKYLLLSTECDPKLVSRDPKYDFCDV